ncbi:MAG: class II aldolase/adducin family protein [Deltaproteobacteria bacterium]|nr:class II aldolase/adducin family protein [Deltaproteobacteria bacterium]
MIRDDLVLANKILFTEKVVDAFGHVSVRDPNHPGHFLMARSIPPPFVTGDDILELDQEGNKVDTRTGEASIERFIYTEIYRARPDVMAIAHSHAEAVLPFTVSRGTPLRALTHNGGFLGKGAPLFEIRDTVGDKSNMLVGNREMGEALARTLGDRTVVLMRGHGFTVVGGSLQEAVYNAVNTVISAKIQLNAIRLGDLTYLSEGEAAAASKIHKTVLDRNWEVWKQRALGQLP